jgi:prepilin-type processing-associated H-X9-DG protein
MYTNDYDDTFPYEFDNDWGTPLVWDQIVQPYVKSLNLFQSGLDSLNLVATSTYTATDLPSLGTPMSYGANAAVFWDSGYGGNSDNECQGPITYVPAATWSSPSVASCLSATTTQVSKASDTIMFSDRFNRDVQTYSGNPGNASAAPFSKSFQFPSVEFGCSQSNRSNEMFNGSFPDGMSTCATTDYPFGPNGGVSITAANKANFAMTDGHAKSFVPAATNPSTWNQPDLNMWSMRRP